MARIEESQLGTLSRLPEGAMGPSPAGGCSAFTTEFAPDEYPVRMIFQKFRRDREGQARSLADVVGFRKNLSREDREYLDRCTRWPYERVWDGPYATGFLVPEIPEEFIGRWHDLDVPRTLDVLRAASSPVETAERVDLLAGLCRTVGFLHERGWVFGDLSVRSMALALGPPRMLLLGCEGAASLANRDRVQAHAPGYAPPESGPAQDAATDVYKLGLVIVRALAPGGSPAAARDPERLRGTLDPLGMALVARALSPARRMRPTAGELADYLELAAHPAPASRPRQPAEATVPLPGGSPAVISRSPEPDAQSPAQPVPVETVPVEPSPSGPAAGAESEPPLEPTVPVLVGRGPLMPAASLAVPPSQPDPLRADDPTSLGKYQLRGRLGAGGMGTVFLGVSPGGRRVAVKVLQAAHVDDPEFRKRFAREVAAAQLVNGFYTAQVLDADPDATPPWLATALVPGPTLAAAVDSDGPMTSDDVRRLGAALAEGLGEIHRCRLVHRDLKPANIILAADGPRIIDFGIARNLDATSALTGTGMVVGTFAYMSPEQVSGEPIGPPSDVFALGAVLTFAGRGRGPFDAPYPAVLTRILMQPPDLDGLPTELVGIVAECLEKDPADRPDLADLMRRLNGPA